MNLPENIADWPEQWRELYEERAGILQFTANFPRWKAEVMAEAEIRKQAHKQPMENVTA